MLLKDPLAISSCIRTSIRRLKNLDNGNYKWEGLICKTDNSVVHLVTDTRINKLFVLKQVPKRTEKLKGILNEIRAGTSLWHKNVVKMYGHLEDDEYVYFILEYVKGLDLFEYYHALNFAQIEENKVKEIFSQIVDGLEYCHQRNVVHMDIKLENIILGEDGVVKIVDFGLSDIKLESCVRWCGTEDYVAPCVLRRHPYNNTLADVWSLGVVLYVMLFCGLPWSRECRKRGMEARNHPKLEFPSQARKVSDAAKDLIKGMLEVNPAKRFTLKDVIEHEWLMPTPLVTKRNSV